MTLSKPDEPHIIGKLWPQKGKDIDSASLLSILRKKKTELHGREYRNGGSKYDVIPADNILVIAY